MNLTQYLLLNGAPDDKPVLLTLAGEYTYGDLRKSTESVARFLSGGPTDKGDRVILLAESGFFWASVYLGVILSGRVCVPLPPGTTTEHLARILEMTEATWIFSDRKSFQRHEAVLGNSARITVTGNPGRSDIKDHSGPYYFNELLERDTDDIPFVPDDIDLEKDLAVLMFTSGSTGEPRGVMVSHRNIMANTDSIIEYLSLSSDDRIMAVLPFYYCFGTSLLHSHLRMGGSVVVDTRFVFPEAILQRMVQSRCTGLAGVPSTFQILLRKSRMKEMEFPDLRYVQQAGGKLPDLFIKELRESLPGKDIYIMYGQTEATARLSYLPPDMLDAKPGSIGKSIPGVRLHLLRKDGSAVQPGEVGEIVVEGDNIALGYWGVPEEESRSFKEGRLYTGDLARMDKDGFLYLVDRAKDILKCGGYRISCKEIENIVVEFEGMVEVGIVGQSDDALGEAVRLYAVHPKGEVIRKDLEIFCGKKLEWSFIPRSYVFLRELPKNPSGKVDRVRLKEMMHAEIFQGTPED